MPKSKSSGPNVDSHQLAVQRSEGLKISDFHGTGRMSGWTSIYCMPLTSLQNICFGYECHVFQTKTADVDNHKLRVHLRVILHSLAVTSANVTSSEFPVSVFLNIYAVYVSPQDRNWGQGWTDYVNTFYFFLSLLYASQNIQTTKTYDCKLTLFRDIVSLYDVF